MYSNVALAIMHHMFCHIANCDNKVRVRITVVAEVAVCTLLFATRRPQISNKLNTNAVAISTSETAL